MKFTKLVLVTVVSILLATAVFGCAQPAEKPTPTPAPKTPTTPTPAPTPTSEKKNQ